MPKGIPNSGKFTFNKMTCQKCHIELQRTHGSQLYCEECSREIDYVRTREWNAKNRRTVIFHYSNGTMKCTNCGEDDFHSLSIDHINNDGAEHRKNKGSVGIDRWLIMNNFPEGFQVLCYNCNMVKEFSGSIEHRKNKYSRMN